MPNDKSSPVSNVDAVSGYEQTWTDLLNAEGDDAMIANITIPLPVLLALVLQLTPAQGRAFAVLLTGERPEWVEAPAEPTTATTLREDPNRKTLGETGIPVRGMRADGQGWDSIDIAHLTRESLMLWLRHRPGLALRTVLALLGHDR